MAIKGAVPIDQFEVFNELARGRRFNRIVVIVSQLFALGCLFLAFVAFLRPVLVVDRGSSPLEQVKLVSAGSVEVREIDAQRFFINMAREIYGWDSVSVTKALSVDAPLKMTEVWRARFRSELNAMVAVPPEWHASGKMSQLGSYVAAKVQNDVDIDLAGLKCAQNPETRFWSCKGKVVRQTQPLFGPPVDDASLKKRLVVRATFKPVPVTVDTLDGLLVDFWDASEPEE